MDRSDLLAEQYADASNLQVRSEFNRRFSTRDDDPHGWIFERLDLGPDADLFEVGCGTGKFWARNADRVPTGWTITLTDFSRGMVRAAREKLASGPVDPRLAVAEASRIPLDADSADAVLANMMLYHVPDREQAFREIARILGPDGRLYASTVSVENKTTLYALLDEVADGPVDPLPEGGFTLENGAQQLRSVFDAVETERYESRLAVTDPDWLVAYALSLPDAEALAAFDEGDAPALRELAARRVEDGPIEMQSDLGLFVARP